MILAIDTCLQACSAALLRGERCWSATEAIGRGHAERIAPLIADLFAAAGAVPSDLSRICCTTGPGSFMGARVGLSLAKGLALPKDLPTVGLTTLEAIALERPRPLGVVIDARRGQAYAQRFGETPSAPALLPYEAARALIGEGPVAGVGLGAVRDDWVDAADVFPDPVAMARHAEQAAPSRLRPLYLRAPDAKPGRAPL